MRRRKFIGAMGTGVAVGLAGCLPDADRVEELPRPFMGEEDAPVVVQVFEDFSCPACARFQSTVAPPLQEDYINTGDVRFEHFDFPIPVHPRWSFSVANAARSIQDELGNEEFFEFSEIMFDEQESMSVDVIRSGAEKVGADPDDVMNDVGSSLYRPVIQGDKQTGEQRGVSGTPTVFVNGEIIGRPDYETISSAIDAQLQDQ